MSRGGGRVRFLRNPFWGILGPLASDPSVRSPGVHGQGRGLAFWDVELASRPGWAATAAVGRGWSPDIQNVASV